MSAVYLLSSLPGLSLGQPPKLTAAAFLAACDSFVPPERLETLRALLENRPIPGADGYAARWFDCDTQIRNAIARRRAAAKGVDPSASVRPAKGCALWLDRAVENAFALKNPLAREEASTPSASRRRTNSPVSTHSPQTAFSPTPCASASSCAAPHAIPTPEARVSCSWPMCPSRFNPKDAPYDNRQDYRSQRKYDRRGL